MGREAAPRASLQNILVFLQTHPGRSGSPQSSDLAQHLVAGPNRSSLSASHDAEP